MSTFIEKKFFNLQTQFEYQELPEWIIIINDLVVGAGFSYSRIAYRIGVCPSTIQKLATQINRKPRSYVWLALKNLHYKIFQSQHAYHSALNYWQTTIAIRSKSVDNE